MSIVMAITAVFIYWIGVFMGYQIRKEKEKNIRRN